MKYELAPDNRNCTDDVLLADLQDVARRLGKASLTRDEYNSNGRFSAATMQKRFGSWNKALIRGNLDVGKLNSIPKEDLLADLVVVAKKLGTTVLSVNDYSGAGKYSAVTVSRAFGSWVNALESAGLQVSAAWHQKAGDEELFSNLASVWEAVGRQPKQNDLVKPVSKFSADTYKRRFGSWRKALETFVEHSSSNAEANGDLARDEVTPLEASSSPVIKHKTPREPSWRLKFLVNRRDRFSCRACGRSPASDAGVVLHVDHIEPWSKGGETTLENLQTLCDKCNLGKSDLPMYE